MGSTFSPDQVSIIEARKQNILVSAAAGSGKTSVLTERIVGLVNDKEHPVDIDRILVVTFTNAAAKEMKERIGKRLNELIAENPGNEHLERQATLIHGAQITTIDSFCLYLVRNHFHKIGLDPSFRIASDGEMKLLKQEVLKDVIKRAYESGNEDFYNIVDCYSKRDNDDSLESSIMRLFTFASSHPFPDKWLAENKEKYVLCDLKDFENGSLISGIKSDLALKVYGVILRYEEALDIIRSPEGPIVYEELFCKELEYAKNLKEKIETAPWGEIREMVLSYGFDRLTTKKCECDPAEKEKAKAIRDLNKKTLEEVKNSFFVKTLDTAYEELKTTGRTVGTLIDLTKDFADSFEEEKRKRGIIDFSDMEHMAIKILIEDFESEDSYRCTDVALGYKDFFEEVMVDEYQDSNMVQELIIQSVSREKGDGTNNRFMVGDVKQSIYRFRMARPEIIMAKSEAYRKGENEPDRIITLKKNYRSRKAVIDTVNGVFEDIMHFDVGGVEYDEDARLYVGAAFPEDTEAHKTELMIVEQEEDSAEGRIASANAIAARIKELVGAMEVYNLKDKSFRKASYKDIAILFRGLKNWKDPIKNAFEKYGIPFRLEGTGSFYNATEISEVISLLRVINNPLDDISLYATLTSHFGNFSDEECARMKGLSGLDKRFLWDKLKAYSVDHEDDTKVSSFLAFIGRYRELAKVLPIQEMISRLFAETGYKYIISALPNGEQRLANVELLLAKAGEYAKTSFHGLFHFIQYIELIKKIDEDEGEANAFDEAADVVRVMTIHASKGLEFPITFIGGIETSFNTKDSSAEFVMDMDAGIGASAIDTARRTKKPTIVKNMISQKIKSDNVGEEMRILYVAMTRAKEKLIMVGAHKKMEEWENETVKGGDTSYMRLMVKSMLKMNGDTVKIIPVYSSDMTIVEAEKDIKEASNYLSLENGSKNADEKILNSLRERFSFEYPYKSLSKLYTKTTVSELKMAAIELQNEEAESVHPFAENESRETIPLFAGGETVVKGTDRGTAYHNVLELLAFDKFTDTTDYEKELSVQLTEIVASKAMTEDDIKKVDKRKIITFLQSDVAKDMGEAERNGLLYKEQPFVIGVPAAMVDSTFPSEETILVQGVIDVYYIKDGKITVLDYKTDRVTTGEELANRYRKQLDYYGAAVTQLTGMEVDKKTLYSFALGKAIDL